MIPQIATTFIKAITVAFGTELVFAGLKKVGQELNSILKEAEVEELLTFIGLEKLTNNILVTDLVERVRLEIERGYCPDKTKQVLLRLGKLTRSN